MKAVCEVCGEHDLESLGALMASGRKEWPDTAVHRGLLLCERCRDVEAAVIGSYRQAAEEANLAEERATQGLPPLPPDELAALAKQRWKPDRVEPTATIVIPRSAQQN